MNRPDLRILHILPRSGGTLISRCLGSMENTVLLSEIHPYGLRWHNPLGQANEWFHLFTEQELTEHTQRPLSFNQSIQLIHKKCEEKGKILVLRDWSHLDYFGKPFIPTPSYQPTLIHSLKDHFNIIHTALVRHPIDVWMSLSHLSIMHNQLTPEQFLDGYRLFSNYALKTGFIRFEDFTNAPDQELSALCYWLKLPFDENYKHKWHHFKCVSGAQGNIKENHKTIRPLKRLRSIDDVLSLFSKSDHYLQALKNLDYANE